MRRRNDGSGLLPLAPMGEAGAFFPLAPMGEAGDIFFCRRVRDLVQRASLARDYRVSAYPPCNHIP